MSLSNLQIDLGQEVGFEKCKLLSPGWAMDLDDQRVAIDSLRLRFGGDNIAHNFRPIKNSVLLVKPFAKSHSADGIENQAADFGWLLSQKNTSLRIHAPSL